MGEDELSMDLFDEDIFEDTGQEEENIKENPDGNSDEGSKSPDGDEINEDLGEGEDNPEGVAETDTEGDDTNDTNDDKSDDQKSSPNLYKSLASVLFEKGVIPSVDSSELEKAASVEDLVGLIQKQVEANEYSSLNDVQKEYLEALKQGLPPERFDAYKRAETQLDSITPDKIEGNENLRRQLIFREFKSKGYSDERATKLTQRSFDTDDDVEDAKTAYESMKVQFEENKKAEIAAIAKQKEEAQAKSENEQKELKSLVFDTNEIIKNYPINEGLKEKMYNKMMNPVSKNPDTGASENELMKYQRENKKEFMHKLYYLFTVTNNFSDFSYFENKTKSNSVKDLEDAITKSTHINSGGDPSFLDDAESKAFEIGDIVFDE